MTKKSSSPILWIRILITGIVVVLISMIVLFLVTAVYAFVLAFRERGSPDTEMISQFAEWLGMWLTPVLNIVLTFFGAVLVGRKAGVSRASHGLLLGLVVTFASYVISKLFRGSLDLKDIVYMLFYLASGYLGGFMSDRKRNRR